MSIQQAYNQWASIYDTNENKTRDLEAIALQKFLQKIDFSTCLEIGCGTGKNTAWLVQQYKTIVAVDFSDEMLAKAKTKSALSKVNFVKADITKNWDFTNSKFDVVSCSLVLEHIENLNHIFEQSFQKLNMNGYLYIGELHPFKQYLGSKARFENSNETIVLDCYTHHISEFINCALKNNFSLFCLEEFFDDDDKSNVPRILSILFQKN